MDKLYSNKTWLESQFKTPGTTISIIAKRADCNEKTIRRWQKKLNVSSRPIAENAWLRQARHDVLSNTANEIIEGHLLGDGNLHARSAWSARYQQSSSEYDFLKWTKSLLLFNKIECNKIHVNKSKKSNGWILHTYSYTGLKAIHDKWYINGSKKVPLDIKLTPLMCLLWYLDDGGLTDYSGNYKPRVRIATDAFTIDEVNYLASLLSDFNPVLNKGSNMPNRGYRLVLSLDFLDWIGPCPVELIPFYGRKWFKYE
jgi:hypothetical protein